MVGGCFFAYVLFQFVIPVMAQLDIVSRSLMYSIGSDPKWLNIYNNYIGYMGNYTAFLITAFFFTMLIWAIANAARKEINEYEV